jgi:diacylglycerol diphosphate phosphatase/phosphatidate phosphatase
MAKLSQAITIDVERFKELWPTYIVDWLLCLVFLVGSLCLEFVMPFRRHFSVKDKEISFPYKEEETITSVQVGLIAYGVPLVAILIINLTTRSRMFDLHQGILGLGLAITLATLITQVAKASNIFRCSRSLHMLIHTHG